jgi:hypothetical protein
MAELRKSGTFDAGVYKRNPDVPGKRNMDGFQAIWEHVHGRPLQFPKPRYAQPIMMNQGHYEWVASAEHPGVYEKLLGAFTERRAEAGLYRLTPGATLPGAGRAVYFAWSGSGRVDGQPLRAFTTLFLDRGEKATFSAEKETDILRFGLPDLRGMSMPQPSLKPAVAAE